MTYTSGHIMIDATALEPLHHGAGTAGNTQVLRRQDVVTAAGELVRVPFISGNSLKHLVREAGVRFALDAMAVADGTLSKPVVDILFSGGHLSKSGSSVDLSRARKLAELFPILSLCGYSAGNEMVGSKLRVGHLHLACEENAWRAPVGMTAEVRHFELPAGSFISEDFGTRHESARLPHVSRLLLPEAVEARAAAKSKAKDTPGASEKAEGSTQMIYDYEVLIPGSRWWGRIDYVDISEGERDALWSALSYACQGLGGSGGHLFRVGAKSSIGLGLMEWRLSGHVRQLDIAPTRPDASLLPVLSGDEGASLRGYATRLREQRDAILAALEEIAG